MMKHNEMNTGILLNELPQAGNVDTAAAWTRLRARMNEAEDRNRRHWSRLQTWSLAAASALAVAAALVVTVAPIRGWAENLLSIFRVEHVAVIDLSSSSLQALETNTSFNQAMGRFISEEVTVTQPPQRPHQVPDVATAAKQAGFDVHLISGETPAALTVRNGVTAQMKLDRDRLQSIVDEAGRSDLHIPASVDGAVIGIRLPAGIIAIYGNCGDELARTTGAAPEQGTRDRGDASCVNLSEMPSPTASVPSDLNPAELAQVALQFTGLSATEAANFTQTIDWTSTFVLPVLHGLSTYEKVHVNGNDAVLLRPKNDGASGHYAMVWVDNGILYSLMGTGDDTAAGNLASQIE